MSLLKLTKVVPRCSIQQPLRFCSRAPSSPLTPNDALAPRMKNRNPMNLERMRIGAKPQGFLLEEKTRNYWNKLELEISNAHTTAVVTHWTGRLVARASTQEWPIRQFLYNLTDQAALRVVGQVISQRCLETGLSEMVLLVGEEERKKEKMIKFISVIEESGLSLTEPKQYLPRKKHATHHYTIPQPTVQPWTVLEPEDQISAQ